MPDGPSSAAPVTTPGPSALKIDLAHLDGVIAGIGPSESLRGKIPTYTSCNRRPLLNYSLLVSREHQDATAYP
jgi:hypothetical protein